jgi:hypothetical protein
MRIVGHNKHLQSEASLFKAVSKWILAENNRVDLAEEIFRMLGISQASVTNLVQQQFSQPNHGVNMISPDSRMRGLSDQGLLSSGAGGPLSMSLQNLNSVQLLPGGHLPPSLALQVNLGKLGLNKSDFNS